MRNGFYAELLRHSKLADGNQLFSVEVGFQITVLAPCAHPVVSLVGIVDVQLGLAASWTFMVRNLLQNSPPEGKLPRGSYPGDSTKSEPVATSLVGHILWTGKVLKRNGQVGGLQTSTKSPIGK